MNIERVDTSTKGNPVYENTTGDGKIIGIPNNGEVYIPAVYVMGDSSLSQLVDALVDELGNNKLVFANVINDSLKTSLKGFTEEKEYAEHYGEYVTVLRGTWDE